MKEGTYVGDNSLNWHNINYISDMWNYEKKNLCWWSNEAVGEVRKLLSSLRWAKHTKHGGGFQFG